MGATKLELGSEKNSTPSQPPPSKEGGALLPNKIDIPTNKKSPVSNNGGFFISS